MGHLKKAIFEQKRSFMSFFILAIVTGCVIIYQAYLLVAVIEGAFLHNQSFQELTSLLWLLLFVLFARVLFGYVSSRIGIRMGSKAKREFRKSLLSQYARNPIQFSQRGQSGRKVSLIMDAVDEVDSYFSEYVPQVIQSSIIPVMILIFMFIHHTNTGWIMLVTTPFIPIFMIIIGIQTKKKSEEQLDKLGAFSGRFLDTLQGLMTLKLFGQAKKQKQVIERSSLDFRDATMEILKTAFTNSFMMELISMLSTGIIALEVALQLILFDGISFFEAFLVLVLTPEYYSTLKELGNAFHNGRSSMGAIDKIVSELEEAQLTYPEEVLTFREERIPPEIILNEVSFSYGEESFALNNINAHFPPYSQIAIVGSSGSGKTTLLQIIAGLMTPQAGNISVNGEALTIYREDEWLDRLSYISQDPYIFSGSIADNIAIGGTLKASESDIVKAAEQAGLMHLIHSLDQGLATQTGEAGRGLSGGEKQRLALARAFLKKPSVILFDEPTTGLDLYTERILQQSIQQLSKHATIITVAHRLHTIQHADLILFLENGKLLGKGTHEYLIRHVPAYQDMVAIQRGG